MTERVGNKTCFPYLIDQRIDRRTVLGGATALSVLATASLTGSRHAVSPGQIRFVITDSRFDESLAFGRQLARLGAEELSVTRGLTAMWQDRLVPHWREQRGVVAGLTTRSVWDGLSQQALGQFRKPWLLGDHRFNGVYGGLHHRLDLRTRLQGVTSRVLLNSAMWPVAMAAIVRSCVSTVGADRESCEVGMRAPDISTSSNQLISWMVV